MKRLIQYTDGLLLLCSTSANHSDHVDQGRLNNPSNESDTPHTALALQDRGNGQDIAGGRVVGIDPILNFERQAYMDDVLITYVIATCLLTSTSLTHDFHFVGVCKRC